MRQIGMLIPDGTNQFFSTLAQLFQRQLAQQHAVLIVMNSDGSIAREEQYFEMLLEMRVDGLVYISVGDNFRAYELIRDSAIPVVVLDREVPGSANVDMVLVDNRQGIFDAFAHLVGLGHRRIGFIQGAGNTEPARVRFAAYEECCERNGVVVDPHHLFDGDFMVGSGLKAGQRILEMEPGFRPTAVIAANDLMAIGLAQRLQEGGLGVPRDISIVGFDDIPFASWTYPQLTSVRQDPLEISRVGAKLLMERLDAMSVPPYRGVERRVVGVVPRLVERRSTGPCP